MAVRPTWKGSLKLSLINIPIRAFPATNPSSDVSFRQIHRKCRTPIQLKKWCPHCDEEVGKNDIVKGYEAEKGRFVLVEEEEIASVRPDSSRVVDISHVMEASALDPIYIERSYYTAPDNKTAGSPFAVIREALDGKAAIGRMTQHGRGTSSASCHASRQVTRDLTAIWPPRDDILLAAEVQQGRHAGIDGNALKRRQGVVENLGAGRLERPGQMVDLQPLEVFATSRVQAIALRQEVFEALRPGLDRRADGPIACVEDNRPIASSNGPIAHALTSIVDVHRRPPVRQPEGQARTEHGCRVVGIETDEPDARLLIQLDVESKVDLRKP